MSRPRAGFQVGIAAVLAALLFVWTVHSQEGLQVGYAVITPEAGSRVPVASALFSLRSGGVLISEAGVGAAEPIRRGRIFVDRRGTDTGMALANPTEADVEAALSLRDAEGQLLCSGSVTISPRGHLARNVGELLAGCALPDIGSLSFEVDDADPGLAAITIRTSANPAGAPLFATLPVLDLGSAAGPPAAPLVFPRIGAGPASASLIFSTQVILLNPSGQQLVGVIRLLGNDGSPLQLNLEADESLPAGTISGGLDSEFDFSLPPDGVLRGTLTASAGVFTGYAVVDVAQGEAPSGTAIFQFRDGGGGIISEAAVGAALATARARIFVDTVQTQTGLAFTAAGSASPARLTFELFDRFGSTVATVQTGSAALPDLPAGGHDARFVNELFDAALPTDFRRGVMEVRSDIPVSLTALKLTLNADSANQPVLTTLPLADLDRPIDPPFVVLPQMGFGAADGLELATRLILINQDEVEGAAGTILFSRSMTPGSGDQGIDLSLPLFGLQGSQFDYLVQPGGANRLRPGEAVTASQIELPQAQGSEIAVAVGNSVQLRPQMLGSDEDDFQYQFFSLDCSVAAVDSFGRIEAQQEGFSTLIVSASGIPLPDCEIEPRSRTLAGPEAFLQPPRTGVGGMSEALFTITVTSTGSGSGGAVDVRGVVQDSANRVYLTSSSGHSVLRASDAEQVPQPFAGTGLAGFADNLPRLQAQFDQPAFLAFENLPGSAILYVSDSSNNRIRRVQVDPVSSPFEGQVSTLFTGLNSPQGIALDGLGHLWVADSGSRTIRRIDLTSLTAETIAGQSGAAGCVDGVGGQARFNAPAGIFRVPLSAAQQLAEVFGDSQLTMILADSGCNTLRLISQQDEGWQVQTLGAGGSADPQAIYRFGQAPILLDKPEGVAVDPVGNIFVSEPGAGRVKTLLVSGEVVQATQDGILTTPKGLAINRAGRLLVADDGTAREISYAGPQIDEIEVKDAQGSLIIPPQVRIEGGQEVTIRGRNFAPGSLVLIEGLVVREVELADTLTIRFQAPALTSGRKTLTVQHRGGLDQAPLFATPTPLGELPEGFITTVAGGTNTFVGDGQLAVCPQGKPPDDECGSVVAFPEGVAVDGAGNLFIAASHRIRKVERATGVITTVAGNGISSFDGDGGPAAAAALSRPQGVTPDRVGNLLIADTGNNRIRQVDLAAGTIATIAGNGCQPVNSIGEFQDCPLGDGGPANQAGLSIPMGVAADGAGNVFITTASIPFFFGYEFDRVRRVNAGTGIIATAAGGCNTLFGEQCESGDGAAADRVELRFPIGLAADEVGLSLIVAESGRHVIQRVNLANGTIARLAGIDDEFSEGFSGDGGPAGEAALSFPADVDLDGAGNLWIADSNNHRIRKVEGGSDAVVDGNDVITTAVGLGRGFGGDDGDASQARLNSPASVALDGAGNLFIADTFNHRVRRVDAVSNLITTVAGLGAISFSGDGDPATGTALENPTDIAVDAAGNLILAHLREFGRVRKVDAATGLITTLAGRDCDFRVEDCSFIEGILATQTPLSPLAVALDSSQNLFIVDSQSILKVDASSGLITTVAGGGNPEDGLGDGGSATDASLIPSDVVVDQDGNLYIADSGNFRVRRVDAETGIITTVAGSGCAPPEEGCPLGDGGPAASAGLNDPVGLALDGEGNLFIATNSVAPIALAQAGSARAAVRGAKAQPDTLSEHSTFNRVRKVDDQGIITTVAGGGSPQDGIGDGGRAVQAALGFPQAIALDGAGNLFIADSTDPTERTFGSEIVHDRVRRVDAATGRITTVAGGGNPPDGIGDGSAASAAKFGLPTGVAVDGEGNLFIADENGRIRAVKGIAVRVGGN